MLSKIYSATVDGIMAIPVTIEVDTASAGRDTSGMRMVIVGLPDNSVKESYSRINSALTNSGIALPPENVTVNLAPGDIRKEGTGFDLPIALGVLASNGIVSTDKLPRFMVLGELSLDGSLQPIRGALPIAIKARELNCEGLIVPEQNVHEAAVVNRLNVYGAKNLKQVVDFLNGETSDTFAPTVIDTRAEFYAHQNDFDLDFADVKGQESVKRAFEIAAAGGHNLIKL